MLLEIGGLPAEELRTALNELQAAELVYESSLYPDLQYAFKHVLTHQVAYGSLLHQRRRALHVQILEAIKRVYAERIAEPVELLAHHALRGEVWEQAVQYLRQAGLKAFNRSANREAAVHLEQAIEALAHLPQTPQNVELAMDLRLLLRPALTALGEFGRAFELAREAEPLARAVGDRRREVLIQSFISASLAHAGRLDEALARAEAGMALAETLDDPALSLIARLYLGMAHMLCGEHRKALEFFERNSGLSVAEIVALHRAPVGPGALYGTTAASTYFYSLTLSSFCLAELGELDEAWNRSDQATRMADVLDMGFLRALGEANLGHVHLRKGELLQAVFLLERCTQSYEKADARMAELLMAGMLGPAFTLSGRLAEAIALFERACAFADAKELVSFKVPVLAHLGDAYGRAGRFGEAIETATRALDLAREHSLRGYAAWALYCLGAIHSRVVPLEGERARDAYQQAQASARELEMRSLEDLCRRGLEALSG